MNGKNGLTDMEVKKKYALIRKEGRKSEQKKKRKELRKMVIDREEEIKKINLKTIKEAGRS
jgi:hypothetical protein